MRRSHPETVLLWSVLLTAAVARAGHAERLTLVRDGQATSAIVLAVKPTRAAQFAAAELQYHLRKMTGATVPVVTDANPAPSTAVLVGESAATRALGLTNDGFGPQEYLIGFRPGALVLMGHDAADLGEMDYEDAATFPGDFAAQGTVYAVYDFLERFGGVRWYLPTELGEVIPERPTLAVGGKDIRRRPAMTYRYVYRGEAMPEDLVGDTIRHESPSPMLDFRTARLFMRRMRQGGSAYEANHSFEGFYERFHTQHPDWFTKDSGDPSVQLCFTNPSLIAQVIADARGYFDSGAVPPRSVAAGDYYALVPMDSTDWCGCEQCRALLHPEPTRGSASTSNDRASDYVFGFINQVAREVAKTHPSKWLAALAYSQYVYPPTREPLEPNVSIMLCLQTRLGYNLERTANDQRVLEAWVRESPERPKFVWLYYCYPTLWAGEQDWRPYPGFFAHSIPGQFAAFHRSGVRGFFIEPSYIAQGQRSPLMDQLELYLTYRLADDPTLDGDREIAEFFERYYGPAAAPMRELYESMQATYADPANHPGEGIAQTEAQAWLSLGTEERLREYGRLMARARRLAKQGTVVHQQRVALFDRGVCRWMREGRKSFLRVRALAATPLPSADVPRIASAGGDPERVGWDWRGRARRVARPPRRRDDPAGEGPNGSRWRVPVRGASGGRHRPGQARAGRRHHRMERGRVGAVLRAGARRAVPPDGPERSGGALRPRVRRAHARLGQRRGAALRCLSPRSMDRAAGAAA